MEATKNPQAVGQELKTTVKHECSNCGKVDSDLSRCSRCKVVYYCNVDCQRKHYPDHKKTCSSEQSSQSTKAIPTSVQPEKITSKDGIDEFKDLEFVGRGNFSQIFKAISKLDDKVYAIKQIDKGKLKRLEKQADVLMEKHCLQKLKGWQYAVQIQKTFQDEISLYIQMEFPENGELWNQCRTFGLMTDSLVKHFFSHIIKAISQLHNTFDIVHRDLKPQNILLTKDNKIKLIDFGTAKDLSRPDLKGSGNGSRRRKVFQNYVGTPNYMAPECIHNKASDKASDIYSLAGVFYFLKVGQPPFTGGSEYLIFKKALESIIYLPPQIFSKAEQNLLLKMTEKDWSSRISIEDVMNHEYFSGIDWNNLSTYENALTGVTAEQQYLIKLKTNMLQYADKFQSPSEQRQSLWKETIRPQLQQARNNIPQDLNNNKIKEGIQIIKIGVYNMLNIAEDTNQGFEELHKLHAENYDL